MPDDRINLPRPTYPLRLWITGSVMTALGSVAAFYVASNFQSITNTRGGAKLGIGGAIFVLMGLATLHAALKIHRVAARLRSGRCASCGIDLAGRFDAPCPVCHPHGDPNFLPPDASREEFEGWLAKQPRDQRRLLSNTTFETRWIDLSHKGGIPFAIAPEPTPDGGGLVITDRIGLTYAFLAGGIVLAASIGLGVCTYISLGPVISSGSTGFAVAAIAFIASLPLPFLLWIVLRIRSRRGRVRILTLLPGAALATDELITRRGTERARAPLQDVWITISNLRGAPGGTHGVDVLGLIIWAPRGPLLLAAGQSEAKLASMLENLPPWLRDREAIDPATVIIRRRPHNPARA